MPDFYKKLFLGALYDIRYLKKAPFGQRVCLENVLGRAVSPRTRPGSDPVSLETKVITAPFGPTGLLKVICSMLIGSFLVVFVLLCAICYTQPFLSHLFMRPR